MSLHLRKVSVWKQLLSGQRRERERKRERERERERERDLAEGSDRERGELLISIDFLIRFHILKCASNLRSDICRDARQCLNPPECN